MLVSEFWFHDYWKPRVFSFLIKKYIYFALKERREKSEERRSGPGLMVGVENSTTHFNCSVNQDFNFFF